MSDFQVLETDYLIQSRSDYSKTDYRVKYCVADILSIMRFKSESRREIPIRRTAAKWTAAKRAARGRSFGAASFGGTLLKSNQVGL
jgi:hypothetical protein